jgi:hypothetical protein
MQVDYPTGTVTPVIQVEYTIKIARDRQKDMEGPITCSLLIPQHKELLTNIIKTLKLNG